MNRNTRAVPAIAAALIVSLVTSTFPFHAIADEPVVEPVAAEQPTEIPVAEPLPEEPVVQEPPAAEAPAEPAVDPVIVPEAEPAPPSPDTFEDVPALLQMAALDAPIEEPVVETAATSTVSILIRSGSTILWSGDVDLPAEAGTVEVFPTGSTEAEAVSNTSVLGVLTTLDAQEDSFAISDLDFYGSMGFLLNCITDAAAVETCSEWQYMVGTEYPTASINQFELEDGDTVFIYFGQPRRVSLADDTVLTDEVFTVTAQYYDPEAGEYLPLADHVVGITQPNPDNPWSPLEIATSTTGALGTTTFSLAAAGSYAVGLQIDYYYPSIALTVATTLPSTGGGSGEPAEEPEVSFDTAAAFAFLSSLEDGGLIENELATDWSAIALAVSGAPRSTRSAVASYLKNESFDLETPSDYIRHAMAMLALDINPYSEGPEDVVTPIVESFDGEQLGEARYLNDDVFALFVLLKTGYSKDDQIIKDIAAYLVDEQSANGSWIGVDMTAAAVQALTPLSSLPGVSGALSDAEEYLRDQQEEDGGFGDAFATAWVLQAIEARGDSLESWSVGDSTPLTYLTELQEEDGGLAVTPSDSWNRAWATASAIPAAAGKTWYDLLDSVAKPSSAPTGTISDEEEEEVEEELEILPEDVAVAEVLPEPLAPTFTYEPPIARPAFARAASADAPAEEAAKTPEAEAVPETLTASASSAPGSSWLIGMLASLWSGIASFFLGLFS